MRKGEDLSLRMKRYGAPGDSKRHMHSGQNIATQHGSPRIPRGCLKFGKSGWDSYAKVPSTQRFQ